MPRERPVHHPRPPVGPEDEDEEDLGIYEDDANSSASEDVMPLGHSMSPREDEAKTPVAEDGDKTPVPDNGESAAPDQSRVEPLDLPKDNESKGADTRRSRDETDEESDRGVRRVDIAKTPVRGRGADVDHLEPIAQTPNKPRDELELGEERVPSVLTALTAGTEDTALRLEDDTRQDGQRSVPPRNTPVTQADMDDLRELESRLTGADSRRACYERAITLLKTRCTSQLLVPSREQMTRSAGRCVGGSNTEFFYINQENPKPMPPLRVWRGFHGNVYFEPISVSKIRTASPPATADSPSKQNPGLRRSKTQAAFRQMSVLDRQRVDRASNAFIEEDLTWLQGQASVGSLRTHLSLGKPRIPYNKDKIKKGSVAKSMVATFGRLAPLKVSGDRCSSPSKAPPFIQCHTQYSNSEKRRMFPDVNSDYMCLQNPDTKAMVHIVPSKEPPRVPMTSPLPTPN